MMWFVFELLPQKAHLLKAWTKACGANERWLDCESANCINWSTHWWIHSWIDYSMHLLGGGASLEEVGH
jgi:hypothetical protein